ncbi:ATP-binding protein [Phenylobacterium sp.]|uniref:ATP-binding protein n=1 Tax=Phenylobacterium sp. TaxID=1871053 RepID=UPI0025F8AA90|nr:ATP-binding protein [Phenylobacterium sp.]
MDRSLMGELLSSSWIDRHLNLVISGSTGTGKTWLACAIGVQAIRNGFPVSYHRVGTLLEDMQLAHIDGSIVKMRNSLSKPPLLILDDFGASTLNDRNKQDLFDIVEARGERASTIIAGQLHWEEWHSYLGAPHLADAIVDRVVHRAHKLDLRGESLRQVLGRDA